MKNKLLPLLGGFAIAFLFIGKASAQVPQVKEAPIGAVGTASTVSVSTSSWTVAPTSSSRSQRSGIKISNPSSNNASVVCLLSDGTPSEATTIRPIEIETGENPLIPVDNNVDVYCLSLHTSAESVHVQEVRQ